MTHTTPIPRPISAATPNAGQNSPRECARRRRVDLIAVHASGSAWRSSSATHVKPFRQDALTALTGEDRTRQRGDEQNADDECADRRRAIAARTQGTSPR